MLMNNFEVNTIGYDDLYVDMQEYKRWKAKTKKDQILGEFDRFLIDFGEQLWQNYIRLIMPTNLNHESVGAFIEMKGDDAAFLKFAKQRFNEASKG